MRFYLFGFVTFIIRALQTRDTTRVRGIRYRIVRLLLIFCRCYNTRLWRTRER